MTELTIKQKKEWAAMLYLKENLTQAEIADKVGVSKVTMNKWVKSEKWEERKAGITITKEEQIKNLYRQVAEINEAIAGREKGKRFASASEADTITKLASAINKMETDIGIADILSVGSRFCKFLRPIITLDELKRISNLYDIFTNQKL
jgi:DNA-binding XRE family transcriptional regulator